MKDTLEMITNNVHTKYPHLLGEGVTVTDYFFINCNTFKEFPTKDLTAVKNYITTERITNFALVILFSNNIIGYRLDI